MSAGLAPGKALKDHYPFNVRTERTGIANKFSPLKAQLETKLNRDKELNSLQEQVPETLGSLYQVDRFFFFG